jgi:predicted nucleic acid-binding protein
LRLVFADTLFWVASVLPGDPWQQPCSRALANLGEARLVTTEEVLAEVLSGCSAQGAYLRECAARLARSVLRSDHVTVVPQSHEPFVAGLDLYERRRDKTYSLVDCISMRTMRSHRIQEVLTADHHFAQEGYTVLIHRE